MKPYGYITLKEAASISGKTVEALKKQSQEGRIRGAVKEGGAWFVPRQEVIVNPDQTEDNALALLAILTDTNASFGITVYMKGLILEGLTTSTAKYVEYMREQLGLSVRLGPDVKDQEVAVKNAIDTYFDKLVAKGEGAKTEFLHLEQVTVVLGPKNYEPNGAILRLRLDAIDGFQLGTLKTFQPNDVDNK